MFWNRKGKWIHVFLIGLVVCLAAISITVSAQTLDLSLDWWTVDGGGGTSTGETYSLTGTVGQPDAGTLSNDTFTLYGGFWEGGQIEAEIQQIFLPIVHR